MTARHRSAALALLAVLGGLMLWMTYDRLWAGPRPVAAQLAQASMEPPMAGGFAGPAAPPGSPCPVDPPAPHVSLRIRVPAAVGQGEEIEYRICVQNTAPADAHHVWVTNPLPANTRLVRANPAPTNPAPELAWNLGTLSAGACREIVLVLAPTAPGDIQNCARVHFQHGQCVVTRVERGGLTIRKCGPAQAAVGQLLHYQLAITNRGHAPAHNVSVLDKLPDGLEHVSNRGTLAWSLGTLQPGECRQVDYQVTARKPGRLCNSAAASADGGLYDRAESCVVVVGPPAGVQESPVPPTAPAVPGGLALIKLGPAQRFVNRPATYQITVSNPGAAPVGNVLITDFLPPGTTLVSAGGGRATGNQVQWLIGALQPGERRTVQLALQAQQPGEVINRATAVGDRNVSAQAEARTLFEGAVGLTFDLEVKDNPVEVNAATTYIVTILNQGLAPATKVQISLTLPEAMQYLGGKGPTDPQVTGRQIVFEPLAQLAPKGEVRYEINVKALQEGEAKARAELRADQLGDRPVIREQSTTIYSDGPIRPRPQPGVREGAGTP